MGRDKLRSTSEDLMQLPELNVKRGRIVYLRGRIQKSGCVSLYMYMNRDGKVKRQVFPEKYVLLPEKNALIQLQNSEVLEAAKRGADAKNAAAMSGIQVILKTKENRTLADYIRELAELKKSEGLKSVWYKYKALLNHIAAFDDKIKVKNTDAAFVRNFLHYLKDEAKDTHYKEDNGANKRLTENTRWTFCRSLREVLEHAAQAKIIQQNPFNEIKTEELPKAQLDRRDYLTLDELRRMMEVECQSAEVKRAFLFACFVGLRFGDLKSLTWGNIGKDDNGVFVAKEQRKTRKKVKAYIPKSAMSYLPQRGEKGDEALVFNLPLNVYANKVLKPWAKAAKVKKNVTFHVSRHTAATLLLNLDVPMEVVKEQLGHQSTATTEIYAKIVGRTQSVAVGRLDGLFENKDTEKK